jgi:glycosyl transferase family 25
MNDTIIYYINLKHRIDRNKKIKIILNKYFNNFNYKRIDAINYKDLDYNDLITKKYINKDYKLSTGQLGCIFSHIKTWNKFIESNYKYCIILEDDVIINDNYYNKNFNKIMESLKHINFDILYLGRNNLMYKNFYNGNQINDYIYEPIHPGRGLHSYILSISGAYKMLNFYSIYKNKCKFVNFPLDTMEIIKNLYKLYFKNEIKVLSIYPDQNKIIKNKSNFSQEFLFYPNNTNDSDTRKNYTIGFIIIRHVNDNITNQYWLNCYKNIRKYYNNKIIIIDDNSNKEYITDIELINCNIIDSEYSQCGELLAYYYFHKLKPFDKAIIIHDSVFINKYFDFSKTNDITFLWSFDEKVKYAHREETIKLLDDKYIQYYNSKEWFGCFGLMSIISYDFLKILNEKYNIFSYLNKINKRIDRQCMERIFAIYCQKETHVNVFFKDILEYCPWGLTFEQYQNNKLNHLPFIKIWTGR